MRRLPLLVLLALAALAVPAAAQTSDSTTASATCADPDDSATLMVAASSGDGGVPVDPGGMDGTGSGGTPATGEGGTPDTAVGDAASVAGDTVTSGGETPAAVVAQDPEPEPEGPGEEQPGEEGEEPPPPEDVPEEAPGGEAPSGETGGEGGGLPRTGLEVLQLLLLGLVLLMVGARIRVLALRRRRAPERDPEPQAHGRYAEPAYDDDFDEPIVAYDARPRDEWAFPDPSEPAPTGLLPSTAGARRQAREMSTAGDRE